MNSTGLFVKKEFKIDDDAEKEFGNIVTINESSNLQIGTGSRVWECVLIDSYSI